MSATIKPQYDEYGYDTGLWQVYLTDGYGPVYESLTLNIGHNGKLIVGQFPDWDNESYEEDGCIDSKHVKIGEFDCPNPYQDDDAAALLYELLQGSDAVAFD